jgi:hypothetical protein
MSRRSLAAAVALSTLLYPSVSALSQQGHMKGSMNMSKMDSEKMPPLSALKPAEGASVEILSPKEGEVIKGDEIPLRFKMVKGQAGSHIHAYVDGKLKGVFKSEQGRLTGIKPGHHLLKVNLVAEDHETQLNATDSVDFVVQ